MIDQSFKELILHHFKYNIWGIWIVGWTKQKQKKVFDDITLQLSMGTFHWLTENKSMLS